MLKRCRRANDVVNVPIISLVKVFSASKVSVNSIISDELLDIWPDGTDTTAIENGYFFDYVKVQLIVCLVPILFQIGTSTKFPHTRKEHADLNAKEGTDTVVETNGDDRSGKVEQGGEGGVEVEKDSHAERMSAVVWWQPQTW